MRPTTKGRPNNSWGAPIPPGTHTHGEDHLDEAGTTPSQACPPHHEPNTHAGEAALNISYFLFSIS